jgi:hypothetical protein
MNDDAVLSGPPRQLLRGQALLLHKQKRGVADAFRQTKKNPPKRVSQDHCDILSAAILANGRSSVILSTSCASVDGSKNRRFNEA